MRWSNEPVLISNLVSGLLVAVSSALLLLDQGASIYLAVATFLGSLAVVVGGGVVARQTAWSPQSVRRVASVAGNAVSAEDVIAAAERGEQV